MTKDARFELAVLDRFIEAQDLLLRKHEDYGPKNIADAPGGALNGLRVRMHDKLARINHLIGNGIQTPANESLRDSFIDMANYAIIGMLVLDEEWPETSSSNKDIACVGAGFDKYNVDYLRYA